MRLLTVLVRLHCLLPLALAAQTNSDNDVLAGRVTDFTGRPVADAQVAVTSLGTGLTRSHLTDSEGRYRIYFPETAPKYELLAKRMGFSPVQRTITRRTQHAEHMTIDLQFVGAPVALSVVEIGEGTYAERPEPDDNELRSEATVPNPVAEILAMRDTLHLSAVQVVGLTDISDSLKAKNTRLYRSVQNLLAKSQEAGDPSQMAGSIAMMLEEAAGNTTIAVTAAEKLLRQEQWGILPAEIRGHSETVERTSANH
jgi:hypothetical protein